MTLRMRCCSATVVPHVTVQGRTGLMMPIWHCCGVSAEKTTRREAVVLDIVYSLSLLCETENFSDSTPHGGYSSAGRASDCGSEGRAFEPRYPPHQPRVRPGFVVLPDLCPRCDGARRVVVPFANWLRRGRRQCNQSVRGIDRVARQAAMGSSTCRAYPAAGVCGSKATTVAGGRWVRGGCSGFVPATPVRPDEVWNLNLSLMWPQSESCPE